MESGLGVSSTLMEGDTLKLCSFFQTIFLALVLIFKNKKSLVAWIILSCVLFFSGRRTDMAIILFSNSLLLVLYFLRSPMVKKVKIIFVSMCILPIFLCLLGCLHSDAIDFYVERYSCIFYIFGENPYRSKIASDSGHKSESIISTEYVLLKRPFWGTSLRQDLDVIPGVPDLWGRYMVHNAYAYYWLRHGFFMLIYYVSFIVFFIYETFRLFFNSKKKEISYLMIKGAVLLYLIGSFIVSFGWEGWFYNMKYMIIFAFIAAFVIKFKPKDCRLLFNG